MNIYHKRVQDLQNLLLKASCEAFLVDDPINLFYLTGQNASAGKLIIHLKGALLVVDSRYFELCKKNAPFPVELAVSNQSVLQLLLLPDLNFIRTLAVSSSLINHRDFNELAKEVDKLNHSLPTNRKIILKPVENLVGILRQVKSAEEIQILKEAALLGSVGFDFVCSLLKEGISEEEVAVELEIFWKRRGGRKVAFDPIIAFGANSAMPHYRAGACRLKKGQNVLIDIGVTYQNYHSDMTRVVYFGKPDPKIVEIHQLVQQAQTAALAKCRPQTLIGEIDQAARDVIASKGYGECFTHSLGHGVGLEIHETPILRNQAPSKEMALVVGMVITIEPGIYLPGIGGVRIEDTIVITHDGYESLTNRPTGILEL